MLELIVDNRSGTKLELVIPVYNEEKRLDNLLRYYGMDFDFVLLDGGSTDGTLGMASQRGCTVYRRRGRESVGENHYVYYVNEVTKSGYCFYLMADEFISHQDLLTAHKLLQEEECYIGIRKIEWIYGEAPKTAKVSRHLPTPRGLRRGRARYDSCRLHNSLHYLPPADGSVKYYVFDLDHLHIKSVKAEFGKFGNYTDTEISVFISNNGGIYPYFRRYIVSFVLQAFWRIWFNKTTFERKMVKIAELLVYMHLAFLCWLEHKYMPSPGEQMEIYSRKYK